MDADAPLLSGRSGTQDPAAPRTDLHEEAVSNAVTHAVMFWALVIMAALVFAPCVLIPIWNESEELMRAEHAAATALARLDARIRQQERLIEALTSDPLVNERLARRDLRFRKPGEKVVPVAPPEYEAAWSEAAAAIVGDPVEVAVPEPQPPAAVAVARRWLPPLPWNDLFGKPPNRTIFLLMSGALLVTALVLYGPATPPPRR